MKIKLLIIILFVLINAIELFYIKQLQSKSLNEINSINSELLDYKYSLEKMHQARNTVFKNDYVIKNDSINVKLSVLDLDKKIIFWHSLLSCNTCVNQEIDFINNMDDDVLRSQILVFVENIDFVQYNRLRRQLNKEIDIVRINHQLFSEVIDGNEPFYFTVDKNMCLTSIYFPKRLTNSYKCKYLEINKNHNLLQL
jgi:hypothetical protein